MVQVCTIKAVRKRTIVSEAECCGRRNGRDELCKAGEWPILSTVVRSIYWERGPAEAPSHCGTAPNRA